MLFSYLAKNRQNQTIKGKIEADTERQVADKLRAQGLFFLKLNQGKAYKRAFSLGSMLGVSLTDKLLFCRNLAVMLKAGLSLDKSLIALSEQTGNKHFSEILAQIKTNVAKGQSFSDSLAAYSKVFPAIFVQMIKVGEAGGNLEQVLNLLADQMEKQADMRRKIQGAMVYPAVVITAMIGIGILMMIVVVPQLLSTFAELKTDLPLTTRLVLKTSLWLQKFWYIAVAGFLFLVWLAPWSVKNVLAVRKKFHYLCLYMPIVAKITRKSNSASFARVFAALIESGVPIVSGLEIVSTTVKNYFFQTSLQQASARIKKGVNLSQCLADYSNIYPPMVVQMVQLGEQTGTLSEVLFKLADYYEQEVDQALKSLSTAIEPVLMIVIGAVVGVFAISMIQPLYSMMSGL